MITNYYNEFENNMLFRSDRAIKEVLRRARESTVEAVIHY